jgi:hypothetical protein
MADLRIWSWELEQRRSGPDWLFVAQVSRESEAALERAAAEAAPAGFVALGAVGESCALHGQVCAALTFVDEGSADAYRRNVAGGEQRNIWVYDMVRVHRGCVVVERGYGGRGQGCGEAETALLVQLFATAGVVLESWEVLAGGNGYDYVLVRQGGGLDSLRAYLGDGPGVT